MHPHYLDSIKSFEGYAPQAKWDHAQFTNGFGTKALYPGEQIDRTEAQRRFAAEIDLARAFVERHARGWDEGTKAALTSLTFNAGPRWASSGLGEAVRGFDLEAVRERFLSYTKAGGEELPGLVRRRHAEATWIGKPGPFSPTSSTASRLPTHSPSLPGPAAPAPATTQTEPPETNPLHRAARQDPPAPSSETHSVDGTQQSIGAPAPLVSAPALLMLALELRIGPFRVDPPLGSEPIRKHRAHEQV
jgi:lysozyme